MSRKIVPHHRTVKGKNSVSGKGNETSYLGDINRIQPVPATRGAVKQIVGNSPERGRVSTTTWNAAPDSGEGPPQARHYPNPAHRGGQNQGRKGRSSGMTIPEGSGSAARWALGGRPTGICFSGVRADSCRPSPRPRRDPIRPSRGTVAGLDLRTAAEHPVMRVGMLREMEKTVTR